MCSCSCGCPIFWDPKDWSQSSCAKKGKKKQTRPDFKTLLKIVEDVMQAYYWKEWSELEIQPNSFMSKKRGHTNMLTSEYDQHCCALIKKLAMGWSAELHLYLSEIAEDIMRDSDIIAWWVMSSCVISSYIFSKTVQRNTPWYTWHFLLWHAIYVESQPLPCYVNAFSLPVVRLPQINTHVLAWIALNNCKYSSMGGTTQLLTMLLSTCLNLKSIAFRILRSYIRFR